MYSDKELNEHLAKEMEGKLFVHLGVLKNFNSFMVNKDFYTCLNGVVLMVNDGKVQNTGDTPFTLHTDCIKVGKYNPNKVYKRKIKEYTYTEFKKLFGI